MNKKEQSEVPLDLLLSRLQYGKYVHLLSPEHRLNRPKRILAHTTSMQWTCNTLKLTDVREPGFTQKRGKLFTTRINPDRLREYQERLDAAFDKEGMRNRMRSVSPDSIFERGYSVNQTESKVTAKPNTILPSLQPRQEQEAGLLSSINFERRYNPINWAEIPKQRRKSGISGEVSSAEKYVEVND